MNRVPGIKKRYHERHDNAKGINKVLSWGYLASANIGYHIFHLRFLGREQKLEIYENKTLPVAESESSLARKKLLPPSGLADKLKKFDVISFDIFDTLIFRPFSEPADLFYLLGEKLDLPDFRRIRMEQEWLAREECKEQHGHMEVTLEEIWNRIEKEVGLSADEGITAEKELEKKYCFANPYMKTVYEELKASGCRIIIISDMYLPAEFEKELLASCGYTGFECLYVSCEYKASKSDGKLYAQVKKDLGADLRYAHVGDNPASDLRMAAKAGFQTFIYPNVNRMTASYRSQDMSPIIGGAYRGIVNNRIYCGLQTYSMEYEYGFICGGLFVLGYCRFIHDYCRTNNVDKLLFLARDGDILKQAYDELYPGEPTEYVLWSRAAATKLMAGHNRYDLLRRYVDYKVNQGFTLEKIFQSMELEDLLPDLERENGSRLNAGTLLTSNNHKAVRAFLLKHYPAILEKYRPQSQAAGMYYRDIMKDSRNAVAIDIGWAGSGAISLAWLFANEWDIPCRLTGIIAGTNTVNNAEFDASETYLQSGKLVPYLYSLSDNRDLVKKHDPNKDYNVFWELLLSSANRQFQGFSLDEGKVGFHFGKADANQRGIRDIQQGIRDFIHDYTRHFGDISYMTRISGRDAYAPVLTASGNNEKYLKTIEGKFKLDINVG